MMSCGVTPRYEALGTQKNRLIWAALPEPTFKERAKLCIKHLHLAVEHDGAKYALIGMRRHYAGYFRGVRGASQLRAELSSYKELEPLLARLEELRETDPERIAA